MGCHDVPRQFSRSAFHCGETLEGTSGKGSIPDLGFGSDEVGTLGRGYYGGNY
jgi:hypothetical protein